MNQKLQKRNQRIFCKHSKKILKVILKAIFSQNDTEKHWQVLAPEGSHSINTNLRVIFSIKSKNVYMMQK